jgi:hypothetical protein
MATRLFFGAACSFLLAAAAHADTATASFQAGFPFPAAPPGAFASFSLNGNGTIAASVTSLYGSIIRFKFNSPALLVSSQFSAPNAYTNPPGTSEVSAGFGFFNSGWLVDSSNRPGPTTVSWTIGQPGSFASVADAFRRNYNGGLDGYSLYVLLDGGSVNAGQGSEWAANIELATAVPEVGTAALMAAGLAVLGSVSGRWRLRPRFRA